MKKSPKHVAQGAVVDRRVGGASLRFDGPASRRDALLAELKLSPKSIALFSGIHSSTRFTAEAAYRAFAGIKRKK